MLLYPCGMRWYGPNYGAVVRHSTDGWEPNSRLAKPKIPETRIIAVVFRGDNIYCITIFIIISCWKVQYLVDIFIIAKALVLNRNYNSTHFLMIVKKTILYKVLFFMYNNLNWLTYIHKNIYNYSNHNIMCARTINIYLYLV